MTTEEETAFRAAARAALKVSRLVATVITEGVPDFTVLECENVLLVSGEHAGASGALIAIPAAWEHEADMEERISAILREESKALAGQLLD